jgi:hypothetical protein
MKVCNGREDKRGIKQATNSTTTNGSLTIHGRETRGKTQLLGHLSIPLMDRERGQADGSRGCTQSSRGG